MDERQEPLSEGTPEERHPEEGRTEETVQQVLQLLAGGDSEPALALFNELHPVDQGEVLTDLGREQRQGLVASLPAQQVAEILEHLEVEEAVRVSQEVEAPILSQVLDVAPPDVAADILRRLPEEQAQQTLEAMREAPVVTPLLGYADETAGGLMTPEYPVVNDDMTTGMALDILRLLGSEAEDFSSIFVVDQDRRLMGTLSITRLALARPAALVRDLMNPDVVSVHVETDQEECARLMDRYDLRYLPVVDEERRLVGIIWSEDLVDVVVEEATEDMYRLAGIAGERFLGSVGGSVRRRLPWLYVNLATAFLAAAVIGFFESTIEAVAALAVFLPVIAGQGGIAGTQALTLAVRSIALGELTGRRGLRLLIREVLLGLIHGLLLSLGVGLVAFLWKGNPFWGLIVGAAMLANMLVAGLAGAGVPLLLRRLRMDPAVSSAVFVTTFTDVAGFLFFLGLATGLLRYLL